MKQAPTKLPDRVAAIQVGASDLRLTILTSTAGQDRIQVDCLKWRHDTPLYSEESAGNLGTAMRELATKWDLGQTPLTICLSSELCVARVIAGQTEEVATEMHELESRCKLYLSLGPGQKVMSRAIRKVDIRRDHGLAAVVNERLLILLATALRQVSIQVNSIEPSAVGLCRLVGHIGIDKEKPVLILSTGESSNEIFISHQGHLFLDYRPAGRVDQAELVELLEHHLARLRRYCRRVGLSNQNALDEIYLAGDFGAIVAVTSAFQSNPAIHASCISNVAGEYVSNMLDASQMPEYAALIGTCLHRIKQDPMDSELNLLPEMLERQQRSWQERVSPWICTAATVLFFLTISEAVAWHYARSARSFEDQSLPTLVAQDEFDEAVLELEQLDYELHEFQNVSTRLARPAIKETIEQITMCMSPDMQLTSLQQVNGIVSVEGNAADDESVFEFLNWLNRLPCLADASIRGTTPIDRVDEHRVGFEIECRLNDPTTVVSSDKEKTDDVI